jgi:hypothetical protein
MRWVRFRVTSGENAEPTLEAKRIRHGADEASPGPQHAADVFDRKGGVGQMLEQLPGHDDVERLVRKGKLVLDVRPDRFDFEPRGGAIERCAIDIDSYDGVLVRVVLRQRTRAATEIENLEFRPAHEIRDQPSPLVGAENELLAVAVVGAIPRV